MTVCFFLIIAFHVNISSGLFLPYMMFCQLNITSVKSYTGLYYNMENVMG